MVASFFAQEPNTGRRLRWPTCKRAGLLIWLACIAACVSGRIDDEDASGAKSGLATSANVPPSDPNTLLGDRPTTPGTDPLPDANDGNASADANASGASTTTLVQSGNGWAGSVNVAATSADYLALSLDQLQARKGPMVQELGKHPAVEAAIRLLANETGVPTGLLTGLCYQESSFDVKAVSNNPNPTASDPQDVGITQAPSPDFQGSSWQDPAVNLRVFINKYFLPAYRKHRSWGAALREWNSGEVIDPNNLAKVDNNTDANYLTEILGKHCMGLD